MALALRVYTNRILNFLISMPQNGFVQIPYEVCDDIELFRVLIPHFNPYTAGG